MIRPVLTELGIFLVPFVLFALFLLASRRGVMNGASWPSRVVLRLTIVALALTIASLVLLANFSGARPGSTYVPAHIENGRLVPGVER